MPRILYIQYTNPAGYPPLEHSSRILANNGWRVLFLGTGAQGADLLRFPPHANISVRQLAFCAPGWRQKLHYLWFCIWVFGWTLRWRPHWVYASEHLSCPIAMLLSLLPGIRVIYHEHDSPTGESPIGNQGSLVRQAPSRFTRLTLWSRRRLFRRSRACIVPSAQRRDRFAAEMGSGYRVHCVWNCPMGEEAPLFGTDHENEQLCIWYHGSITPPQLPATVLRALAQLPDSVRLRIAGYETVGHPGYVKELQELASRLGIRGRFEFLGTAPTRRQLLEWCSGSDIGIALFPKAGLQPMAGASNKPFDYMTCGLPLLVSDLCDWREMYVEPGYGLSCDPDDPGSIASALRWFLDHPVERRAMGRRGRQRILTEWNYERQFLPVLETLNAALP